MSLIYKVKATDTMGEEKFLPFVFDDLPHAHSSHLVFIMQSLDEKYLDLVSITVL